MKTINRIFVLSMLLFMTITACRPDQEDEVDNQATTQKMVKASEDNSTAENMYQSVDDQVDLIIDTRGGGNGNCPMVTVEPNWDEFPRTITIDFGTDGCVGADGRIRTGIINVHQTAAWWVEGATRTTTFTDFFTDGAELKGTETIINEGFDVNGNITFSRKVAGAQISFPDNTTLTWEADQLLIQTDGGATPLVLLDNVFEFTWTANGVNREGQTFEVNTLTPLLKKKTCPWLVSGIIQLSVDGNTLTLDHGNGICDKFGTLTLPNGAEIQIELRRTW